jgi:hypothetical protein
MGLFGGPLGCICLACQDAAEGSVIHAAAAVRDECDVFISFWTPCSRGGAT